MEINYNILWEIVLDKYPNTKHISDVVLEAPKDIITFTGVEEYKTKYLKQTRLKSGYIKYSSYKKNLRTHLIDSMLK